MGKSHRANTPRETDPSNGLNTCLTRHSDLFRLQTCVFRGQYPMQPGPQPQRRVRGKASCHICPETIPPITTREAFEQWNATYPATPQ